MRQIISSQELQQVKLARIAHHTLEVRFAVSFDGRRVIVTAGVGETKAAMRQGIGMPQFMRDSAAYNLLRCARSPASQRDEGVFPTLIGNAGYSGYITGSHCKVGISRKVVRSICCTAPDIDCKGSIREVLDTVSPVQVGIRGGASNSNPAIGAIRVRRRRKAGGQPGWRVYSGQAADTRGIHNPNGVKRPVGCRGGDRKSTRLNSSHSSISYAV